MSLLPGAITGRNRSGGPYIVDGGCFITQSNKLFVMDPAAMTYYIEAMAKTAHHMNNINSRNGNNSKNNDSLNNDGLSNGGESNGEEQRVGGESRIGKVQGSLCNNNNHTDNNNNNNIKCCMICEAKAGMWSVYAVCEDFSSGFIAEDEEDEMMPPGDDGEDCRVLSLVILNNSDIHMSMVNPEFLDGLSWEIYRSILLSSSAMRLPHGVNHSSSVCVESGQIGIFCEESIRMPLDIMNNNNNVYAGVNNNNSTTTTRTIVNNNSISNMTNNNINTNNNLMNKIQQWLALWHERLCELTCTGNQVGIMDITGGPVGVVCASGLGDQGEYDVQVLKDNQTNEVYGCRIVFMRGN